MKRGDIVLCQLKGSYSGKARPAVIVQSDEIANRFESITICPITSCTTENANTFRIAIKPGKMNQLKKNSYVMVDKIGSYPKKVTRPSKGKLSAVAMSKVDEALKDWLDLV